MKNNKHQKLTHQTSNSLWTNLSQEQEESVKGGSWRSTAYCRQYQQMRSSGNNTGANLHYSMHNTIYR